MSETGKAGSGLPFARSFKELVVYQKSRALAREVFQKTTPFPKEEAFALTDQWRRAARSVGAQIAEAWAKRRYPRHFASKLTDADGEQQESQHWTIVAYDCGYLTRDEAQRLGERCQEIGRILGSMINEAESFCGDGYAATLRDSTTPYFSASPPDDPAPPLDCTLNTEH